MQINEKKSEYQRKRTEDKSMGNYSAGSDPHKTTTNTIATASTISTSTTTTTVATVYLNPSRYTPQNEKKLNQKNNNPANKQFKKKKKKEQKKVCVREKNKQKIRTATTKQTKKHPCLHATLTSVK